MSTRIRLGVFAFGGAAIAALGVLVVASAQAGCTVLTNDALPDDAGPYEAGDAGDAAATACGACSARACLGPWAVCLLDDTCRSLHVCASSSLGPTCLCSLTDGGAEDGGSAPDPRGAYLALASCDQEASCGACSSDCHTDCAAPAAAPSCDGDAGVLEDAGDADASSGGDAGDAGEADAAAPEGVTVAGCASCVSGKCGDPKKACGIGSECEKFLACAHACADTGCIDACGATFATGKEAAAELSTCTFTACEAACGL